MGLTRDVAEGIHRIEDAYTNWYLVEEAGRVTVVDTGVPTSWGSFQSALREIGRSPGDVDAVVLTHAHFDHVGFAEKARTELRVPVWVHEGDVGLTKHPLRYDHERPRAPYLATQIRALPIVFSLARNRAFMAPAIKEVSTYEQGVLAVPGSPHVIPTPGHTYGHCSLHFPGRGAVIAGDAIVTLNPYRGTRGPQIVSGAATADSKLNLTSLDALAATGAKTVLTGHGEPWTDGVESAVARAREVGAS